MKRFTTLSLLAALLAACTATPPAASGGKGTLVIRASYEDPPVGQPISVGGYGYFATLDGGPEAEVPSDGELRVDLEAGAHDLAIVTRPASDELGAGEEREFYDVSTACEGEVEVLSGGEVHVTYHAVGGEDCRVTTDQS